MKRVRIIVGYGWSGCEDEVEIEVEDDATEEEIEKMAWDVATDAANERVECEWAIIEDGE